VPYVLRRFAEHVRAWLPARWRAQLWGEAVWMAAVGVFSAGTALAYGLGGALYGTGALSLGAVYLLAAYMAMLAEPIETIRTQLQDLQRADAGIARVRELLELRSRLDDGTEELPPGPLAVEFCNVGFEYAEGQSPDGGAVEEHVPALHDVTFALAPGRVLGLLGRTGSGKTTLARLLFRWHDVRQGAVRVGGLDVRRIRLASLRARVGLVTQDVQVFDASLRDNITFYDPDVPDERVLAALGDLGLQDWLGRLPGGPSPAPEADGAEAATLEGNRKVLDAPISAASLSAGEAQLVALARLFLKDPGLVILDEASSRLDPVTEALLERALARLLAGRTVIIISHRPAAVERADAVLVLEGGRVVEYGARARLAGETEPGFAQSMQFGTGEVLA
jgi:ABC-type multidrug transport system fused ATPase/permease subunit